MKYVFWKKYYFDNDCPHAGWHLQKIPKCEGQFNLTILQIIVIEKFISTLFGEWLISPTADNDLAHNQWPQKSLISLNVIAIFIFGEYKR